MRPERCVEDERRVSTTATPGPHSTFITPTPVLAHDPALADHLPTRALGAPLPPLEPDRLPGSDALRRSYLAT